VVKVTVIATGFDLQPAAADSPLGARKRMSTPGLPLSMMHSPTVRAASQQVLSRGGSVPAPMRMSQPSSSQPTAAQAVAAELGRRTVDVSSHVSVGADPRGSSAPRAFGAAAMHDEATLEVPAFLRRSRP
jgi:hypothetical protein